MHPGGLIEYDQGASVSSVVAVKNDGSVQMASVIADGNAPETYAYELDLPAGAEWQELENGALIATDANGALLLGIAPAWAADSNGNAVPTKYELDGSSLVQVVDHQDEGYSYPIVADPWMGAALFQMTAWNASAQIAKAQLSAWGSSIQLGSAMGVGGWAAGQLILKDAGWSEFKDKVPAVTSKATYRQQFDCHVLGAYTPVTGGATWDLEGTRSNNPNWLNNVANHKCNW